MPHPSPSPDTPDILALAEVFRAAGAHDPETWARSQVHEGINQWARFCVLQALSRAWLPETALDWVTAHLASPTGLGFSGAQLPDAVQEMVRQGVRPESIVDLVRVVQFEALFHACQVLNGAPDGQTPGTNWALFEVDEHGRPTRPIEALHESLLAFDPSGKELRPRST